MINVNYDLKQNINTTRNIQKPAFGSNCQIVSGAFGEKLQPYYTMLFRNDLNWERLIRLIFRRFKKSNKLNIVCVPCADGSEPVSLLLKFAQKHGFKNFLDKFKVIKAYDIKKEMIDTAKSGEIPIINSAKDGIFDFLRLFLNAKKGLNKNYFIKNGKLILSEQLKKCIEYDRKDILTVLENLPKDEDTVLLLRNIFAYLDDITISLIGKFLSKLKKGSLLVIGNYDKEMLPEFNKFIKSLGYKKTLVKNCYRKTR